MRILVLHHASIEPGSIVSVDPEEAEWYIRSGRGVEAIEAAIVVPPESAALPKPQPRKPGRPRRAFSPESR